MRHGVLGRDMRLRCPNILWGALLIAPFFHGCGARRPVVQVRLQDLGRFELREPAAGSQGTVIGSPHGSVDPLAERVARAISDRTGAGLAVAYGFKQRRLSVNRPIVRFNASFPSSSDPRKRGSVYQEYKRVASAAAQGGLNLYIGIHSTKREEREERIEVVSSGLSFEEAEAVKESYERIRDRTLGGEEVPRLPMAVDLLDRLSWRASSVKHHGILLAAKRGVVLRLPPLSEPSEKAYSQVLSRWVNEIVGLLEGGRAGIPQMHIRLSEFGRIEWIGARGGVKGAVIAAPHGSFDEHTDEVVKRLGYRTGVAAVIAKGFTPTEAGGWRINVNRPTEKTFQSAGLELHSERAARTYRQYKDLVLRASSGELRLYVDIHQYGPGDDMQIATVGVSRDEARVLKALYQALSGRLLRGPSELPRVGVLIEPLDQVEIGAWAAKNEGILSLARKSLHIEIPRKALMTFEAREAYTQILAGLLRGSIPFLVAP